MHYRCPCLSVLYRLLSRHCSGAALWHSHEKKKLHRQLWQHWVVYSAATAVTEWQFRRAENGQHNVCMHVCLWCVCVCLCLLSLPIHLREDAQPKKALDYAKLWELSHNCKQDGKPLKWTCGCDISKYVVNWWLLEYNWSHLVTGVHIVCRGRGTQQWWLLLLYLLCEIWPHLVTNGQRLSHLAKGGHIIHCWDQGTPQWWP